MQVLKHSYYSFCALLGVLCFALSSTAYAAPDNAQKAEKSDSNAAHSSSTDVIVNQEVGDPCYTLQSNEDWHKLFSSFSKSYQDKDFEGALAITDLLKEICAASPVLNYSIATTHRELGNTNEALRYYKQAIENTKRFGVSDELLTKFWFARYEMENADSICKQTDLDSCEAKAQKLEQDLNKAQSELIRKQKLDAIVMWTGAGVGIAGVILTVVGGSMLASTHGNEVSSIKKNDPDSNQTQLYEVTLDSNYRPGIALLGAGIGIAVAGAVMTGIGGYYYTHSVSDDVTASWNITPQSLEFGLQF